MAAGLVALAMACSGTQPLGGAMTSVRMSYARAGSLFDAPFPDESRRLPGDRIDLSGLPGAEGTLFVRAARDAVARDARGFSQTSSVYFQLTGPIEGTFPALADTRAASSPIQIVDVDPASPGRGSRTPVVGSFLEDAGPFGVPNLLGLTPAQGLPLRPGTLYAAVVLRSLLDRSGQRLQQAPELAQILADTRPEGMSEAAFAAHRTAIAELARAGVAGEALAALAVFRTDDPLPALQAVLADALPRPVLDASFIAKETFDDYCVYTSTVEMPVYQSGTPPYSSEGGHWVFEGGKPVLQRMERANVVFTVPRRAMPLEGFPTVVFSRTGAGGDRPLVDRGVHATAGGPAAPGSGPAREFARSGFAAISIDGPLGGLRNPDGSDEQFLIFNIGNPSAIRDNVRQSAVELALAAHLVDQIAIDGSACAGFSSGDGKVRIDASKLAIFGHSMGATIAPLALAIEPRFGAAILSGAGGSWIENVLHKQKPIVVKPFAELLVGYKVARRELVYGDPALGLVQWAAEAADPPVYGSRIVRGLGDGKARHVLVVQGIVDHYILPPMANAMALSLGLDVGGEGLDGPAPELAAFVPTGKALPLIGRGNVALPASGNVAHGDGSRSTAVVVQHLADGIEDGHEVVFQLAEAKYQYRCFLSSWARGDVPVVPPPLASEGPCP
jgi:hypothetical protein